MYVHKILLVDDELNILKALNRLLMDESYKIFMANSAIEAEKILRIENIDLVISDENMPGLKGQDLFRYIKKQYPDTIRIMLTAYTDVNTVIKLINEGEIYRFLTKPWNDEELKVIIRNALNFYDLKKRNYEMTRIIEQKNHQLKQLNFKLEKLVVQRTSQLKRVLLSLKKKLKQEKQNFTDLIIFYSSLLSLYNKEQAHHSFSVANLVEKICRNMKLEAELIDIILSAALLHDIGLIGVGGAFFDKDINKLTTSERIIYSEHPVTGQILLRSIEYLDEVNQIVRSHHEAFDGSGFPDKLWGSRIPLGARIIRLANDFINLTTRKSTLQKSALEYMLEKSRALYDPEIIPFFLEILEEEIKLDKNSLFKVKVKNLKEGTTLCNEIYLKNGFLLLSKGKWLTAVDIRKIKQMDNLLNMEQEVQIVYRLKRPGK